MKLEYRNKTKSGDLILLYWEIPIWNLCGIVLEKMNDLHCNFKGQKLETKNNCCERLNYLNASFEFELTNWKTLAGYNTPINFVLFRSSLS